MNNYKKTAILIAEDDEDDRFLLQTAFSENGYTDSIEFVKNGAELMKHLNGLADSGFIDNLPLLILLDLNMPRKDGREALNEIKADKILKKIPVVIFSAAENITEIKRCYYNGASSYVIKPNTFDGLVKAVRNLHNYWLDTVSMPA